MGHEVQNQVSTGKDGGMRKSESRSWSHWCTGFLIEIGTNIIVQVGNWVIRYSWSQEETKFLELEHKVELQEQPDQLEYWLQSCFSLPTRLEIFLKLRQGLRVGISDYRQMITWDIFKKSSFRVSFQLGVVFKATRI